MGSFEQDPTKYRFNGFQSLDTKWLSNSHTTVTAAIKHRQNHTKGSTTIQETAAAAIHHDTLRK